MEGDEVFLSKVAEEFRRIAEGVASHKRLTDPGVYPQPSVYLVTHLAMMRASGWETVDFDELAAVSGASALFGYEPDRFGPKYAHLLIDIDRRIAEATGFALEWAPFSDAEDAWRLLKETLDSGRPAKGWDWENILFAGYREADDVRDRQVFAMADGPEYYVEWKPWDHFKEWADRMGQWNSTKIGLPAEPVAPLPPARIAVRVIGDLIRWSADPPERVTRTHPNATFGLAGIEAYARDCEDAAKYDGWLACHPINPQWIVRNSTAVYLNRVAESGAFGDSANERLRSASADYRSAYESWREFYRLLGHGATEEERKSPERRHAGAEAIRTSLDFERRALASLEDALDFIGEKASIS